MAPFLQGEFSHSFISGLGYFFSLSIDCFCFDHDDDEKTRGGSKKNVERKRRKKMLMKKLNIYVTRGISLDSYIYLPCSHRSPAKPGAHAHT